MTWKRRRFRLTWNLRTVGLRKSSARPFTGWLLEAVHEFGFTLGYEAGREGAPVKHKTPEPLADRIVPQDDRQTSMDLKEAYDD